MNSEPSGPFQTGLCLPCVRFINVNHITEAKRRDAGIEEPLLQHINGVSQYAKH